jgi:signal transduction histidine kinase
MKLLNRAILYYSLYTFLAFVVIGTILFTSIRHIVFKQVSEALLTEKKIIQEQLEDTDTIPDFSDIFNHQIEVTIFKHRLKTSEVFLDTLLYDSLTKSKVAYRFLEFKSNTADNRGFIIKTSQSIEEEKRLLYEILGIITTSFAVLSLILIIIISSVSRGLWGAFYNTLSNIQRFDMRTNSDFHPVSTKITEFYQLNRVLKTLTDKIKSEYINLKEFSENASHEIQTPLTVIRMRIEQILQSADINDELAKNLILISQSVDKISRINQALTLISKIENRQYPETAVISANQKISEVLVQFQDFIHARQLKVSFDAAEHVELQLNPDLADFLFTNLIGNAIKHNIDRGWISIILNNQELILKNTGKDPQINTNLLFLRFKKGEHSSDSYGIGLGLAIVKKVTDLYGMQIVYEYSDSVHTLLIEFRQASPDLISG